ncbi:S-layer homology domain-containing protein [Halalkalibacterium ligniniphilum]|uniref:S-layer homology domain-containing protein n=1 Tax=Halalkalibacterium ligniniphilum TaxID=1134413 RepID=UPI00034CF09C|nr:S-layer homology domain-containing protein [Halalkalibacterium ligniniphilum]
MSYQPKSYRKFLATSVSAAMVATTFAAVGPIQSADAAEQKFTDVSPERGSYEAINALVEMGVIKGYTDGTFRPTAEISRMHAAVLFARAFDLDTENVTNPGFADVPESHQYYAEIAAAVEAGLFNKAENFNPTATFTRAQGATVLARAWGFDFDAEYTFSDNAGSHAANVARLASKGYIKGYPDGTFKPNNPLTRENFAQIFHRTIAAEGLPSFEPTPVHLDVASVTSVDSTTIEVTFNGTLTAEEAAALEFTFDPALAVTKVELKAEGEVAAQNATTTVVLTTEAQAEGTNYSLVAVNGDALAAPVVVEPAPAPEVPADLEVASVSAITTTQVEVEFTAPVETLTRNQVVVTASNDDRAFVSSVELAEDGKSAKVNFFQNLTDKETYAFNIIIGEQNLTSSFEYQQGKVSTIEVSDVRIANTVNPFQLPYKVVTDTGVDVTAVTDIQLRTDNETINGATSNRGVISSGLSSAVTAFAEIVVPVEGGQEVKSNRFTITTQEGQFDSFARFTVAGSAPIWADTKDADLVDFVKLGATGQTLQVSGLDQFGAEYPVNAEANFTSLTPNVLLVDTETGALTPRAEGTALVRVTIGDKTRTVEVKVAEAAKLTSVKFERGSEAVTSLRLNNVIAADAAVDLNVKFLDQYGDAIDLSDKTITFESTGSAVNLGSVSASVTGNNTLLTLNRNATGSSTVTVKDGNTVLGTIDITVQAPGTIAGYRLDGFGELDINGAANENTVETRTLSLVGVDANDVRVSNDPAKAAWEVEDADGNKASVAASTTGLTLNLDGTTLTSAGNTITLPNVPGTYTLRATVGNLVVEERTITVVDTESPYVISQTVGGLEFTFGGNFFEELSKIFRVTQDGEINGTIQEFSFLSGTQGTIATTSGDASKINASIKADGSATLYIETITVNGKKVDVDFQVRVTVDGVAAAEDQAAADAVIAEIAALNNTAKTYAADVDSARTSYEALTSSQKALVTNYADLQAAEAEVAASTELAVSDDLVVTALDNTAKTLSVAASTTAGGLKAAIESAIGASIQFTVTDVNGTEKADDGALVTDDKLVVTAEDATTNATYTVTVN